MNPTHEHCFYKLLAGAEEFMVSFPCTSDGEGPFWDMDGSLINLPNGYRECSRLLMVALGNDMYRIAANPFLEAPTTLNWGDEVFARVGYENTLELTKIKTNQRFRHTIWLMQIDSEHPLSKKIHEFGGGWECVAGGIVTISIPNENWEEFERWKSK